MPVSLRVLLFLTSAMLASAAVAHAAPAPARPTEPEAAVEDQLGRTTPRGTVLGFIRAAQAGDYPVPLVAVRGYLFAAVSLPPERRTVCSYQGQRLKPLADLGFSAHVAEAFVPSSESQPALVAMGVEVPAGKTTRHELRLFSMNADGHLQLLDSEELLRDVRKLLFHPSGRFLYVSDTADTLFRYAIGPEGRLEPTESIDHAGGGMAITLPAPGS